MTARGTKLANRLVGILEHRLQSWRDEKATNKYGMAEYADRAIRLIEADIAKAIEAGTAETGTGSVSEDLP